MKVLLLLLFTCLTIIESVSQDLVTYTYVDTSSYNAYLSGDWNKILYVGKKAIDNNIDYYYLRMRMGYAFFMKKKYRMAIPHYRKALEFNTKDPSALEYLFYCYNYSGRTQDADKLVANFSETLKTYVDRPDNKAFTSIGFNITHANVASQDLVDEIINTAPQGINGIQKALDNYTNFNLSVKHRLGRSISAKHSTNLLYKKEFVWLIDNTTSDVSEMQDFKQFNYNVSLHITPVAGLTLKPHYSYISYSIPVYYEINQGNRNSRVVNDYVKYTDFAASLQIIKHLGIFRMAVAGSYSSLNFSKQNGLAASLSVYPLGNLNLYYTINGYSLFQNDDVNTLKSIIQSHELGFKVNNHLWIELSTLFGGFTDFYDPFSEINYNGIEKYNSISGINIVVPFTKHGISLFASYKYHQSESIFVPFDNSLNYSNNIKFNYKTISGGLIWKL